MTESVSNHHQLTIDPAFIGSDAAHLTITEFTYLLNMGGVPEALDVDHASMRIARAQWNEALGKEFHDALGEESSKENEACDLAGYLFIEPIRDRIMADAISDADDEDTYRQVLTGRFQGQPDWSRVEATEELLIRILAYTPIEDRAPLFCFLGWLRWYRGQSSTAAAYFDKALASDDGHRFSRLMRELVHRGTIPLAAQNEYIAYHH